MTRACDLALLAHHLRAALGYAKALGLDAHCVGEIDHLVKQVEYILKEEGVDGE